MTFLDYNKNDFEEDSVFYFGVSLINVPVDDDDFEYEEMWDIDKINSYKPRAYRFFKCGPGEDRMIEIVPDVVIELDLTGLVVVLTGIELNLADFIVRTLVFALLIGDGMAIFDAILEHADVRLACFAHASDDEIGICDIAKT
jgi:hypothetical protein